MRVVRQDWTWLRRGGGEATRREEGSDEGNKVRCASLLGMQ